MSTFGADLMEVHLEDLSMSSFSPAIVEISNLIEVDSHITF